ncbi:unnamed protein product [Trichobilharzia szidati]|nr:unnamed protein product [Trichobilharzia szidati]
MSTQPTSHIHRDGLFQSRDNRINSYSEQSSNNQQQQQQQLQSQSGVSFTQTNEPLNDLITSKTNKSFNRSKEKHILNQIKPFTAGQKSYLESDNIKKDIDDNENMSNLYENDNNDNNTSDKNRGDSIKDQGKSSRLRKCREKCRLKCKACLKRIRLPPWLARPLLKIYTHTSGVLTYALFLLAIYACIISVKKSVAIPPECRLVSVLKQLDSSSIKNHNNDTNNVSGNVRENALECRNGEALSVLIFYGFGFLCGEIMELLHLPGLLGMLLGGLFLRNIGSLLIPQRIFHAGKLPNGSYPLGSDLVSSNMSQFSDSEYPFNIDDTRTQFAALLLVNPDLSGILRQLALTTILTRAGLGLDPQALKQVCGSVFRLAFIPCLSEAASLMLFSHLFIGWPWAWGAILGFVCAAVSPAVIVPNMMRLEVTGWGVAEGIPTLVVAASSLDDVVAITGFGVALAVASSAEKSFVENLIWGPLEAIIGASFGAGVAILLLFFPPPKLEHSHLVRGILLICFAITGLVGSVAIDLPGAGALSCLTLAFVVATGWRNGFPWRLTQSTNLLVETQPNVTQNSNRANSDYLTDKYNDLSARNSMHSNDGSQEKIGVMPNKLESIEEQDRHLDDEIDSESLTRRQRDPNSSNVLESLVEFHPYYCSILRQQYGQHSSGEQSSRSSIRNRIMSDSDKKRGDLPALAVAVAATGTDRRGEAPVQRQQYNYPQQMQPTPVSVIPKPRTSRRFSLPEPTAHYELESFSVPQSFRRGRSPSSANALRHINRSKRRIFVPTFAEQYAAYYNNQPVEKVEEVEENDDTSSNEVDKRIRKQSENNQVTNIDDHNASNYDHNIQTTSSEEVVPATPAERGLACLNSMRRTMAVTWWFVQPILFTLIGSEVNITHMPGGSTGRGLGAFFISLFFRLLATILAVLPSKLNMRERLFVGFAWLPKATVQAAIGPVALDTARRSNASAEIIGYGEQVVTLAALSILITAPLGAVLMPLTAPYLLHQDIQSSQVLIERTQSKSAPKKIVDKLNNKKSDDHQNTQTTESHSPQLLANKSRSHQQNTISNTHL